MMKFDAQSNSAHGRRSPFALSDSHFTPAGCYKRRFTRPHAKHGESHVQEGR